MVGGQHAAPDGAGDCVGRVVHPDVLLGEPGSARPGLRRGVPREEDRYAISATSLGTLDFLTPAGS